jgi:hypothetical protein
MVLLRNPVNPATLGCMASATMAAAVTQALTAVAVAVALVLRANMVALVTAALVKTTRQN